MLNTHTIIALSALGFASDEIDVLHRIERTLHRWSEQECGDGNGYASWAIERDEDTGIPYRVTYPHVGKSYRVRIADKERGAKKRLATIMAKHTDCWAYDQGDPRGCALWIGRWSDVPSAKELGSYYTRGVAVF